MLKQYQTDQEWNFHIMKWSENGMVCLFISLNLKPNIRNQNQEDMVLKDMVQLMLDLQEQKLMYQQFQDPILFSTVASGSSYINVYEKSHGRDSDDTVRFRGPVWTSSDPDGFQNPVNFDGISGSNIAKSDGYSITVGKRDSSGDVTATDDYYYFTVDTNTATSGGVSGGGDNCTAGPATLEA